ncbi:MAG: dihydroorotase [Burkholderiaceae bacterium]|jgi:dihydroorotase|nr:dihydroorotase [Burkholderiaceae bacterium]
MNESAPGESPTRLSITLPDDWHLHLRDGEALRAVVAASATAFGRAIVMPNLRPPVVTVAQALAYRTRIEAALADALSQGELAAEAAASFRPLMTLYLTDRTSPEEIRHGVESGAVSAVKLYPAGATTNSDAGVTDMRRVAPALAAMERHGLPLLVHGEVADPAVDVFDRERVFIERVMTPLRRDFPALRVVFEHVTTAEAVQYVRDVDGPVAATMTPQHLLYNRNAIFTGGLRPHWYCLPVLKRERHRLALVEAATSGDPRFFLGTDSAPHAARLKEHAAACAGCYTAPHAIELYATVFEMQGRLDRLEAFASFHGADFYGLPRNQERVELVRENWTVPESLPFGADSIVPLAGGEVLRWRLYRTGRRQPE